MCGRFVAALDPDALATEFEISILPAQRLPDDYNVAPTKRVYLVAEKQGKQATGNELEIARWGLIPPWAKDRSIASRMINARVETVAEKPSFRNAFAKRRCLIPATGYYEWSTTSKQPFYIEAADQRTLAMAGLYQWWRDASVEESDPAAQILTCTIITTAAEDTVAQFHHRMPVLVAPVDRAGWLDHSVAGEIALAHLTTAVRLTAYPVSTTVNRVSNNGPGLIAAVPRQ